MITNEVEVYLTTKEVSEKLKVNKSTIERWRAKGIITSYRLGPRVIRFKETEISKVLKTKNNG